MRRGPWYGLYKERKDSDVTFIEVEGWRVPAAFQTPAQELEIFRTSAGLLDLTGWGVLRLSGDSRLDFVQRMSTNDVLGLAAGAGAPTIFTTPIGRIIDLTYVVAREEDVWLVTSRGADERVANWLRRHIFFNDDVVVENLTEQQGLMGLKGPQAAAIVAGLLDEATANLPLYHSRAVEVAGVAAHIVRGVPMDVDYLLLTEPGAAATLWTALEAAVKAVEGAPVGELAVETARIAAGQPRFERELSEDYIPLEAGLKGAVSFNKGCYTGQEIIARLDTYQRLAKRLVVLQAAQGTNLKAGDELQVNGSRVGQVTSVAPLINEEMRTALAYLKSGIVQPGRELTVADQDAERIVQVLAVPGES